MSLYDRYLSIIRAHVQSQSAFSNVRRNVFASSPLLKRISAEMDYSPPSPGVLPNHLNSRSESRRAEFEKKQALHRRAVERHAELTALKASLTASLEAFTWQSNVDEVAAVVGRLSACERLLQLLPAAALESEGSWVLVEEDRAMREAECAPLRMWVQRLQSARGQIKREIDEIEASEPYFEPDMKSPLAAELDAVLQATHDAEENLRLSAPKEFKEPLKPKPKTFEQEMAKAGLKPEYRT